MDSYILGDVIADVKQEITNGNHEHIYKPSKHNTTETILSFYHIVSLMEKKSQPLSSLSYVPMFSSMYKKINEIDDMEEDDIRETFGVPKREPLDVVRAKLKRCLISHSLPIKDVQTNKQSQNDHESYQLERNDKEISALTDLLKKSGEDIQVKRLLDVGGGDGLLTENIKAVFQPKEIYITDVANFLKVKGMTYLSLGQCKEQKEGIFDMVSCMMSIHHYRHPDSMFQLMFHLLRVGGYLLIKEHDVEDEEERLFLDAVHSNYCYIQNENDATKRCVYQSYSSLKSFFEKNGFERVAMIREKNSIQQKYHVLFRRIAKKKYTSVVDAEWNQESMDEIYPNTLSKIRDESHLKFLYASFKRISGKTISVEAFNEIRKANAKKSDKEIIRELLRAST